MVHRKTRARRWGLPGLCAALLLAAAPAMGPLPAAAEAADGTIRLTAEALHTEDSRQARTRPAGGDRPAGVTAGEGGALAWTFSVAQAGRYTVEIDYDFDTDDDDTEAAAWTLRLDSAGAEKALKLERPWRDAFREDTDVQGNAYRPQAERAGDPLTKTVAGEDGVLPWTAELTPGTHTLRLEAGEGSPWIREIRLAPAQTIRPYADQLAAWKAQGAKDAGQDGVLVEAERAALKSDQAILPINDRTSPYTSPYDPNRIVYNTIGGGSWGQEGQWVEWTVTVPEDGLYALALRLRQDQKSNQISFRALTIDGAVPFEEAAQLEFGYDNAFRLAALGKDGGEPYRFYLTAGTHRVRLTAALGGYASVIEETGALVGELNRIYREVVMVTGPSPDTLRDYRFPVLIPDTLAAMKELSARLKEMEKTVGGLSDGGGESATVFRRVYFQLDAMTKDPGSIAKRLSDYKNTVTNLGTWLTSCRSQPLELDTLQAVRPGAALKKGEPGFGGGLLHFLRQYLGAYRMDYSRIGVSGQEVREEITVWAGSGANLFAGQTQTQSASSGRDQAQLIADLARNLFTPAKGIGVNVQLVANGSLLPATLAGKGPDVALGQAQADPMNYALRGAVTDLSGFDGAEEVRGRFSPAACLPFEREGHWYAVPETMSYPMLFCRDDVLEELGIDDAWLDTWDTLLETVLPILQKKYLSIGIPAAIGGYGMFLYQNGGAFYTADGSQSALNSPVAISSFEDFVTLFSDYRFPLTYEFSNRFRSGEMPIAVQDFTAYNQLSVFAPEIEGLWSMRPVPGTRREDGAIDRSVTATVTGCVMLSASRSKEAAWEFIRWWTQADVQERYSRELETLVGTAARNPTANLEAMEKISWSRENRAAMERQRAFVQAIPEVPGGYFTSRHFDFAFRRVVNDGKEAKESLYQAIKDINHELTAKQKEFARREAR